MEQELYLKQAYMLTHSSSLRSRSKFSQMASTVFFFFWQVSLLVHICLENV